MVSNVKKIVRLDVKVPHAIVPLANVTMAAQLIMLVSNAEVALMETTENYVT